jgi:hypothetical protein
MLDELKVRGVAVATSARDEVEAFDMASATKAEVEVALPSWHAKRQRLTIARIHQRETSQGDKLFVTLLRGAGVSLAVGLAILAGIYAYSTVGPVLGFIAGAGGLVVGLAVVSGAVVLTRGSLARQETARQATVARLDLGIRQLDERISRAFLQHCLVPHTRTRSSY